MTFRSEGADAALLLGRGETPWAMSQTELRRPAAILDWGIRAFSGPALFVDHHAPEAQSAEDQLAVSGYGLQPEASSSVLLARIVPDAPAWVAAVGAVGDLGHRAWELPDLRGVVKSHIKALTPLINAPRRLPNGPLSQALAVLVENETSRAALSDHRLPLLRDAKNEWTSAFRMALKVAPRVDGNVAVIRFSSPYQIHPLVATTWSQRLQPRVVLAANDDYIPGLVNFSVRGGKGDLRALLRSALSDETGEFAHGHDRATGGSLTPQRFTQLVEALRNAS